MSNYGSDFFRKLQFGSRLSARVVIPLLIQFVGKPRSVIDVGCGTGTWLSVFHEFGIEDVIGVDGDYVDPAMLEIPKERFIPRDLANSFSFDRQFDLVISLEVAEHLPPTSARGFVDSLARLGPIILFSAAIPGQGGQEHLNEQWPDFWMEFFAIHQFIPIDCLRRRIWNNEQVEWWYAQNSILYVSKSKLEHYPILKKELEMIGSSPLSMVHPKKFHEIIQWAKENWPSFGK